MNNFIHMHKKLIEELMSEIYSNVSTKHLSNL